MIALHFLAGCEGPLSTLDPAGPSAAMAAWLWWGMLGLFTLVFVGVCGLWIYAMLREPAELDEHHSRRVQRRWIIGGGLILPLASIAVILAFGIPAGHRMLPLPPQEGNALVIEVTALQWRWDVSYPGRGIQLEDRVVIPAGAPVDIHLTSKDVIHSFWVPRLAGKLDAIPGRTNVLRLEASAAGEYLGQCAEFCGLNHAHMTFTVEALPAAEFDAWLRETGTGD